MPTSSPILVWFRKDLRVADNPALHYAAATGRPVIPLYIWAPDEEAPWGPGAATQWWTHQALRALSHDLEKRGSRLIIRCGSSPAVLREVIQQTNAHALYWNRRYEPEVIQRDSDIKAALKQQGIEVKSFNGSLLFEPHTVMNKSGTPYKVFTPFYKACLAQADIADPLPAPKALQGPEAWPETLPLDALGLLPVLPWDKGFYDAWKPGSKAGLEQLEAFCDDAVADYPLGRDRPARAGTSRMSPYLHHGELSPRTIWHRLQEAMNEADRPGAVHAAEAYLRQIVWREFATHLMVHFPHTPNEPLREEYARFPWRENVTHLKAWQQGMTGYPMVDAGMRELWHTGWMHNRVRMISASFLVKHLLIDWQQGARWFWDTLVDADLANNTMGWQWTAGCGADASPFFRIFNPITQGDKFDPGYAYIRRWVPELKNVPDKHLTAPWTAPNIKTTYPAPIVDHAAARKMALEALGELKDEPLEFSTAT